MSLPFLDPILLVLAVLDDATCSSTPTVAVIVAAEAEIAVTDTLVSWPANDFEFGVEVELNDVFPAVPGIRVARVTAVLRQLQVALAVGLDEADLVVVLVGVPGLRFVDVPDQEAVARQLGVVVGALTVLERGSTPGRRRRPSTDDGRCGWS